MRRLCRLVAALLAAIALASPALPEAPLRITRPLDLVALPLLIMEHEHLVERVVEAMGLGPITVAWSNAAEARPLEAKPGHPFFGVAQELAAQTAARPSRHEDLVSSHDRDGPPL